MPLYPDPERRRTRSPGFDVAEAMELNLNSFPTRAGMLTLLRSWLYIAERDGVGETRPDYAAALRYAVEIMEQSSEAVRAIAILHARGWQVPAAA